MRYEEAWKTRPRSPKNRATSIICFKMLYHSSDSTLIDASRRFPVLSCNDRRLSKSRQAGELSLCQIRFSCSGTQLHNFCHLALVGQLSAVANAELDAELSL